MTENVHLHGTGGPGKPFCVLSLYVTGTTPRSGRAISNIRKFCEAHLKGRYDLEVVDVSQRPELLVTEQIIVAPCLLKKLPFPHRRFFGDMSDTNKILIGLDLLPPDDVVQIAVC